MKRIIISIALCILAANAFAQEGQKSAKDRLTEIENMAGEIKESKGSSRPDEVFSVDAALSHLYVGYHIVSEDLFPGGKSHEVGLSIIQFKLEPVKWFNLTAGMDIKWDRFIAKGKMYEIGTDGQYTLSTAPTPNRIKSKICAFGVSAPAALTLNLGKVGLKFGADATYDFDRYCKIKNKYRDDNGKKKTDILNGGQIENFRLSYFCSVLYDDLGLYVRYCPGTVIPGSALVYDLVSVGIILEM